MAYGIDFFVTDQNPLPTKNVETDVAFNINEFISDRNPLPVTGSGSGGGATQKYNVITGDAVNGVNRVFVLPTAAAVGSVRPHVGSLRLTPSDFAVGVDNKTVTFEVPATPQTNDIVYFDYQEA